MVDVLWLLKVTHGERISSNAKPFCLKAALIRGTNCSLSPEKLLATKPAPNCIAKDARSMEGKRFSSPYLLLDSLSLVAENCPFVRP